LICCRSEVLKSRMNEESLADASGEHELAWKPWFPKKRNCKERKRATRCSARCIGAVNTRFTSLRNRTK